MERQITIDYEKGESMGEAAGHLCVGLARSPMTREELDEFFAYMSDTVNQLRAKWADKAAKAEGGEG